MTQYSTLNMKLSNSQLKKLKLRMVLIGDFSNETNFPHKWLLTDTQVSRLRQDFANNLSANIKLYNTELSKVGQLE